MIHFAGVNVQALGVGSRFDRNAARAIEKYIDDFIDWEKIEPQLAALEGNAGKGQQVFAHSG